MTSMQLEVSPEDIKAEAVHHVDATGEKGDIKEESVQHVNAVGGKGNCLKVEEYDGTGFINNCQESTFWMDDAPRQNKAEGVDCAAAGDSQIDILDHGGDLILDDMEHDSTEYSSSVEDVFSDYEDSSENESSNAKIESSLDEHPPIFDGWNRVFRKKRLTDHWRKFIQPLMWRCRWIELRVKELQSQVTRYDRELQAYNKKETEEVRPPLPQHFLREDELVGDSRQKLYRRRKRKKIEDMVDVSSYISQHVLFSYFDSKPEIDGLSADEGFGNQEHSTISHDDIALNFEWPILEIKGNDKFLEQILLDIESVQVRVLTLKSRLDKTICDNAAEFCTPGMFIPGDPNYRPSLSPRCSPIDNGGAALPEAVSTSPYAPEFENEELVLSDSAVSSYGDAGHPDIIESTVDLLSSAIDYSSGHNQIGNLGTDVSDDILISNQVAEEDLHSFENASYPLTKPLCIIEADEEESAAAHRVSSSETETDPDIAPVVGRKPTLKRCAGAAEFHLRRSKRKRKMRKTSPGSWNGEKMRRNKQPRKQGPH